MISTKVHGYLDYLLGALLIVLPFLLDFPEGAATLFPIVLGAGTIMYSLITDYELGIAQILSMRAHLGIDMLAGLVLLTAPWLFNFYEEVKWPFVILGVVELGSSLFTSRTRNTQEREINEGNKV